MNINCLKNIIEYSNDNRDNMESKVKKFYLFLGMSSDKEFLNIIQIVRESLEGKGYHIFEIPFADKEIGALCYKGDSFGYIVLNTSLPKVNVNFALCHELYHVFYQDSAYYSKLSFADGKYYEYEEESAANLFAGMILMPETGFQFMYNRFKRESAGNEKDTIIRLMNYYQAPYMAVLIRCYELKLPGIVSVSEELLSVEPDSIRERMMDLWLDDTILDATNKDDYSKMEKKVQQLGKEYLKESYLNERTIKKVLQNMKLLYSKIKGE